MPDPERVADAVRAGAGPGLSGPSMSETQQIAKLGMPKWGLSMTEGTVVQWLVEEGTGSPPATRWSRSRARRSTTP